MLCNGFFLVYNVVDSFCCFPLFFLLHGNREMIDLSSLENCFGIAHSCIDCLMMLFCQIVGHKAKEGADRIKGKINDDDTVLGSRK